MRLQFRVWDKEQKKMLYDGFVIRHNNPPVEFMENHNKFCEEHNLETSPIPEYTDYEAEPCEIPTEEQLDYIRGAMHDGSAQYELIDYSNFYGQENYITMQCTGFHDRYGKLIWEGDLLEQDGIVDSVEKYYGHWVWNGQVITDFRDFDRYGNDITGQGSGPVTIQVDGQEIDGVVVLGYQGDTWGLETKNLVKIGNKFEQ